MFWFQCDNVTAYVIFALLLHYLLPNWCSFDQVCATIEKTDNNSMTNVSAFLKCFPAVSWSLLIVHTQCISFDICLAGGHVVIRIIISEYYVPCKRQLAESILC